MTILNPFLSAGSDVLRAYEDASTAIGRLDATGRLSSAGLRELLVLRCIAVPAEADAQGMIALVLQNGERHESSASYGRALREGAARARGGALPSLATLHELLRLSPPDATTSEIDGLLRDTGERVPPVLKAVVIAQALRDGAPEGMDAAALSCLAALAVTLVLCVGGATTDAWVTLPPRIAASPLHALRETFGALAREARAAERGLAAARDLIRADEARVRDSLGRAAYSALDVLALLGDELVITVPETARALDITPPTANAAVARLVELRIAREATGKARSRAFVYEGLLAALAPVSTPRQ